MSQQNNNFDLFDPTGMLKQMRDSGMDAWSKMMIQLVNTDAYAASTGAMLDAWLSSSTPFRKAMESIMTQAVTNCGLPTRDDITRLAERLTNIELRLDDMEAKLEQLHRSGAPSPAAAGVAADTGTCSGTCEADPAPLGSGPGNGPGRESGGPAEKEP